MKGIAEKEEQAPRAMKDKTELGDLGSNMFAGERPHALVVLRWSMKVWSKLTSYILIKLHILVIQRFLS